MPMLFCNIFEVNHTKSFPDIARHRRPQYRVQVENECDGKNALKRDILLDVGDRRKQIFLRKLSISD